MNVSSEFGRWLYEQRTRDDVVGVLASAMARGDCDLTRPHLRAAMTKAREEHGGTVRKAQQKRARAEVRRGVRRTKASR